MCRVKYYWDIIKYCYRDALNGLLKRIPERSIRFENIVG